MAKKKSQEPDMPTAIQPLGKSSKVNGLIYSDPGVGKTRLLGTLPGKVLLLRPPVDHTDSIRNPSPDLREWVLRDWNEAWEALDYARQEGDKWDHVCLDSGSLFQDIGLDDIWETVLSEKPGRRRYGLDKQEYGINQFRFGQWVRHMVGAQMTNFWMTAHVMELPESMDPDKEDKLMPYIAGKVSGAKGGMAIKICGYMNIVAYLDLNSKGTRILRTNATDTYYAKDQFDAVPGGKLVSPTMPKLLELIDKSRSGARTAKRRSTTAKKRRSTTK